MSKAKYEKEFSLLKSHDPVQFTMIDSRTGLNFIVTAGHGYLVVPKDHAHAAFARSICEYGYVGELAYYLEEDCEYTAFLEALGLYTPN